MCSLLLAVNVLVLNPFYLTGARVARYFTPPAPQLYRNFQDLAEYNVEGLDYKIEIIDRQHPVTVVALHGGGIEWGTDRLAHALAQNKYNVYIFKGLRHEGNRHLHIASHHFNEPRLLQLLKKTQRVVSLHGYGSKPRTGGPILLGGRKGLKYKLWLALRAAGFMHAAGPNTSFQFHGRHKDNIVNRAEGQSPPEAQTSLEAQNQLEGQVPRRGWLRQPQGVQIELPLKWRQHLLRDPAALQTFVRAVHKVVQF